MVGLAPDIPLSRRVQLAALAHIRHTHTRYDALLREADYITARATVQDLCLNIMVKWRGDEETGRDQLDEVLREVVVISDSEDSEDSTDSEHEGGENDSSDDLQEIPAPILANVPGLSLESPRNLEAVVISSDGPARPDTLRSDQATVLEVPRFVSHRVPPKSRLQKKGTKKKGRKQIHRGQNDDLHVGPLNRSQRLVDIEEKRTRRADHGLSRADRRGFKRYQAWNDALHASHASHATSTKRQTPEIAYTNGRRPLAVSPHFREDFPGHVPPNGRNTPYAPVSRPQEMPLMGDSHYFGPAQVVSIDTLSTVNPREACSKHEQGSTRTQSSSITCNPPHNQKVMVSHGGSDPLMTSRESHITRYQDISRRQLTALPPSAQRLQDRALPSIEQSLVHPAQHGGHLAVSSHNGGATRVFPYRSPAVELYPSLQSLQPETRVSQLKRRRSVSMDYDQGRAPAAMFDGSISSSSLRQPDGRSAPTYYPTSGEEPGRSFRDHIQPYAGTSGLSAVDQPVTYVAHQSDSGANREVAEPLGFARYARVPGEMFAGAPRERLPLEPASREHLAPSNDMRNRVPIGEERAVVRYPSRPPLTFLQPGSHPNLSPHSHHPRTGVVRQDQSFSQPLSQLSISADVGNRHFLPVSSSTRYGEPFEAGQDHRFSHLSSRSVPEYRDRDPYADSRLSPRSGQANQRGADV